MNARTRSCNHFGTCSKWVIPPNRISSDKKSGLLRMNRKRNQRSAPFVSQTLGQSPRKFNHEVIMVPGSDSERPIAVPNRETAVSAVPHDDEQDRPFFCTLFALQSGYRCPIVLAIVGMNKMK